MILVQNIFKVEVVPSLHDFNSEYF